MDLLGDKRDDLPPYKPLDLSKADPDPNQERFDAQQGIAGEDAGRIDGAIGALPKVTNIGLDIESLGEMTAWQLGYIKGHEWGVKQRLFDAEEQKKKLGG